MLVRQLPRESSTAKAQWGDDAEWGDTEHLLAMAVDRLTEANWQRAGDKKVPRPKPIRRPGQPTTRSTLTPTQMKERLLEQQRRREG